MTGGLVASNKASSLSFHATYMQATFGKRGKEGWGGGERTFLEVEGVYIDLYSTASLGGPCRCTAAISVRWTPSGSRRISQWQVCSK